MSSHLLWLAKNKGIGFLPSVIVLNFLSNTGLTNSNRFRVSRGLFGNYWSITCVGTTTGTTVPVQVVVISGLVRRVRRLVLAAAEVTAATATTAAVATGDDTANQEDCLARRRRDHEVCVDILLAKLFGDVQPQGAVVVVDVPLG